jgi:hypothetical protein
VNVERQVVFDQIDQFLLLFFSGFSELYIRVSVDIDTIKLALPFSCSGMLCTNASRP